MERVLSHLRGNLIAYLALFVALGGTAYAAVKLEKNSVKSKQIKDGQVKTADLGAGAVNASKVANGSLLGEDFAAGQLPAGAQGEQGPAGQDATRLFAYISDAGNAPAAQVGYGSGVTTVSDPPGPSNYVVTFNRDLTNCVVQVTPGLGLPVGTATGEAADHFVVIGTAGPNTVNVGFFIPATTDSSFFITAFC